MSQARTTTTTRPGAHRFPGPETGANLVCFVHAGALPTVYQPWSAELAGRFGVWVGTVRHHDAAGGAGPMWKGYAERQADALEAVTGPLTLYGHSMGAVSAYETARELRRRGRDLVRLVVSGCDAPHLRVNADLPRDPVELVRTVAGLYGGIPEMILAEPELAQVFGEELRADFDALAAYTWTPGAPLDIPLTVAGGTTDPVVSEAGLRAWAEHTTGAFRLERLPGSHFFTDDERPALLALMG
ncbi:thioesterase II family protein [Actinorugispora endophytica]|uniref:Surfactin synthase thioesterase subunit n=1 Tax=Actinorugispora endophytica TaxID=1605990 RepID=A0A4R6UPR5_9ACTN|nr:alpha/beta fold hydrolase [Actinorugispora endophytica]TDQ49210.1 surfactin synthase thioesterase subunit [Actinorugispora endophytica]